MQPEELCEAIRQKCADQHWYGPGWPLPATEDDPRQFDFALPPLTEEQVGQAETTLSFPLSPVVHALYTRLANGGFGPDCGFFRLTGEPSLNDRMVVERYQDLAEMCSFFDLEGQVQPGEGRIFADSVWPRFVVPICDEGCGNNFCLDATTGHILKFGLWGANQYRLTYVADSLEQWLQAWIEGTLYPPQESIDHFIIQQINSILPLTE